MLNITESNVTQKLWDYFNSHYFDDYNDGPNQYVTDVLSLAQPDGSIPKWASVKLMRDHGSNELEYLRDGNPQHNALHMLEWLGYWLLLHTTI